MVIIVIFDRGLYSIFMMFFVREKKWLVFGIILEKLLIYRFEW